MSGEELLAEARKFERPLLNFFWRQGVSYTEGEDLVQETYLRLWKYRESYRPTAKLSTFLFLMARQVRLDAVWMRGAAVLVGTLLVFGIVRFVVKRTVNGLLAQPSDALFGFLVGAVAGALLIVAWGFGGFALEYSNLAAEAARYVR